MNINITNPNAFRGSIVARRTYQRPKLRGGFESWNELVDRVISHQKYLWERRLGRNLNQKEKAELSSLGNLIREKKALLAGRTLWLGGTETSKRRHISNFNCSYVTIKTVNDVVDAFWLLLNGSGVGFKPMPGLLNGFKKPINDVVVINTTKGPEEKGREENIESFEDGVWTIKIGDSGEAWAKSIGKLLAGKYEADKLVLDFSEVRGAGGRLAGYGWISSGDKVISEVYPKIAKLLSNKAGKLLDEIDILDIINYLGVIQTGRRGAEIALLDYGNRNWKRFANAKKDFWLNDNHHRTQSNNSLVFNEKPSHFELNEILDLMWESGGSEPGMLNGRELRRRAPWAEGVNPCCVTGDTLVMTSEGPRRIDELTNCWTTVDGLTAYKTFAWETGEKEVVTIKTKEGFELRCTPDHRVLLSTGFWRRADELIEGDELQLAEGLADYNGRGEEHEGYLLGMFVGDGNWSKGASLNSTYFGQVKAYTKDSGYESLVTAIANSTSKLENRRNGCKDICEYPTRYYSVANIGQLPQSFGLSPEDKHNIRVLENGLSSAFHVGFLRGFFDADGSIMGVGTNAGVSIRLSQARKDTLQSVQRLLLAQGIMSRIYLRREEGESLLPDGQGGRKFYRTKPVYELIISGLENIYRFREKIGFNHSGKKDKLNSVTGTPYTKPKHATFEKLEISGTEVVYDANVATIEKFAANGIVVHNCEILLADKGVCNLVEVDLNAFDRWVDLEQAVYLIARANYRQTLVDFRDGILQDSWHQTNEFLRLCGVSLTGWALVENKISDHDIKRLKNLAITGAYSMAMELGSELPKNVTTIKPSGSVSKVMGTTEGVHRPLGKFIFNNITFSKHEPIVEVLRNHGYNVFDNPSQPDGVVVTFPIRWDQVDSFNASALDQLNNYKRTMLNWTEQNTSVTISYDEPELRDIEDWLYDNWDSYVGVSFIKRTDPTKTAKDLGYLYLPQEVVDESRFNDYLSRLKPINEELLFDTGGIEDVDFLDDGCEGGVCPVR